MGRENVAAHRSEISTALLISPRCVCVCVCVCVCWFCHVDIPHDTCSRQKNTSNRVRAFTNQQYRERELTYARGIVELLPFREITTLPMTSGVERDETEAFLRGVKQRSFQVFGRMERAAAAAAPPLRQHHPAADSTAPAPTDAAAAAAAVAARPASTTDPLAAQRQLLAAFHNARPPTLPPSYLPPPALVATTLEEFAACRESLLATRLRLAELLAPVPEGRDGGKATKAVPDRRRRRDEGGAVDASDDQNSGAAAARLIASRDLGRALFEAVARDPKDDAAWDASLWRATRVSAAYARRIQNALEHAATKDQNSSGGAAATAVSVEASVDGDGLPDDMEGEPALLVPLARVSLLARLTPGMAHALLQAATRRFIRAANGHGRSCHAECWRARAAGNGPVAAEAAHGGAFRRIEFEVSVASDVDSALASTLALAALLRHTGAGCWLYAALAAVELPLPPDTDRQLQQVLRSGCQALKTALDARPDLRADGGAGAGADGSADDARASTRSPCEMTICRAAAAEAPAAPSAASDEADPAAAPGADPAVSTAPRATGSTLRVRIAVNDARYLERQDVLALVTLIVVVGKFFHQANPALLPL
jgi:hypothetical protein